jgi:acyl carrier protein
MMDQTQILDKVKEIIQFTTHIKPEELNLNALFAQDLNLDSLTIMEICVNVDQAFQLDLPEEAFDQITSAEAIVVLVTERLASKT